MTATIATETADFRTYAPIICDDGDGRLPTVTRLCESFEGGRWEPFTSNVPLAEALAVLTAAGYDLDQYR